MKTKEEILRSHIPPPKNEAEKNDDVNILAAMEEYAQYKVKEAMESVVDWLSNGEYEASTRSAALENTNQVISSYCSGAMAMAYSLARKMIEERHIAETSDNEIKSAN